MSLYIGNLSQHTQRDELERVFCRFGPCNVRFKRDGYGFVVFDYPPDATKALRALKGRNICGEPLTLTWSNKQPSGSFQRFARGGGRNFELRGARNSERLGYVRRKESPDGWRDQGMDDDGRAEFVDVSGEERADLQDDFKDYDQEGKDYGGEFHDDGGGDVVTSLKENGRWGEPIQDPAVEGEKGNAVDFDRYEPYGYDMKHGEDSHHKGFSGHSPAANSQENMGRAQIGEEISIRPKNSKFQLTCYRCGDPGHKMRDCPKQNTSRKNFNRLDVVHDNKEDRNHRVGYEDKFRSDSWMKLRSSGNALSMRHQSDDRRVAASPQYHVPFRKRSPPIAKEIDRHQRREFGGEKRSRNGMESPKRYRVKRSRRSISSTLHSDYSTSHSLSNSQSPKSLQRSRFHSRSSSSEACPSSSKSRSSSKSLNRKGRSLNSRRSSSPTSLSVSLNQPLPSSEKQIQSNSKTPSINATALDNADHLVAQQQQIDNAMESENLQSNDACIAVNGNSAGYTTKVDALEKDDQYVQVDNNESGIHLNPSDGVTNLTKPNVAGNLSPEAVKEKESSDHTGIMMMNGRQTEIQKQASQSHANPHSRHSTTISTEEMYMVLKNYGLELPGDDEKSLTVENYFGSARLWPWHIVYYRRLKKGPISAENYARRVAQNHEFGIVDKYIRSSSGWGEVNLENS